MASWNPDPILKTLTAPQLLAVLLFGEARGETLEGQLGVACVVRNRVLVSSKTLGRQLDDPTLWQAIMLKPWAFSCFDNDGGSWNAKKVISFAQGLNQLSATQPTRQLLWIATGALMDALPDVSRGATHYFVRGTKLPSWAAGRTPVTQIDSHDFFKLNDTSYV